MNLRRWAAILLPRFASLKSREKKERKRNLSRCDRSCITTQDEKNLHFPRFAVVKWNPNNAPTLLHPFSAPDRAGKVVSNFSRGPKSLRHVRLNSSSSIPEGGDGNEILRAVKRTVFVEVRIRLSYFNRTEREREREMALGSRQRATRARIEDEGNKRRNKRRKRKREGNYGRTEGEAKRGLSKERFSVAVSESGDVLISMKARGN